MFHVKKKLKLNRVILNIDTRLELKHDKDIHSYDQKKNPDVFQSEGESQTTFKMYTLSVAVIKISRQTNIS